MIRRFTELAAALSRERGLDGASVPDCYNTSKKPSKATIGGELRAARAEIERLTNLWLSDAVTSAIEHQMTDSQRALVATLEHLKAEGREASSAQRRAEQAAALHNDGDG